jgi:hypothetical protein
MGEKSVAPLKVTSTPSTSLSVCSDFTSSWNAGSARSESQFFFASSRLVWASRKMKVLPEAGESLGTQ